MFLRLNPHKVLIIGQHMTCCASWLPQPWPALIRLGPIESSKLERSWGYYKHPLNLQKKSLKFSLQEAASSATSATATRTPSAPTPSATRTARSSRTTSSWRSAATSRTTPCAGRSTRTVSSPGDRLSVCSCDRHPQSTQTFGMFDYSVQWMWQEVVACGRKVGPHSREPWHHSTQHFGALARLKLAHGENLKKYTMCTFRQS